MQKTPFSKNDIQFIGDTELIIRKNNLVKSIFSELSIVRDELTKIQKDHPISGIKIPEGKISKGENYNGLPYLVLDHPSFFKKDNIFTMRTIFWWGNFYSLNFILKGKPLNRYKGNVMINYKKFKNDLFYLGSSPWIHDLDHGYVPVHSLEDAAFQEQLLKNKFFKLVRKHELTDINDLTKNAVKFYEKINKYILD